MTSATATIMRALSTAFYKSTGIISTLTPQSDVGLVCMRTFVCCKDGFSGLPLAVGLGKNGVSLVDEDDGAPATLVDTTLLSVSVGEEVVIPPPEAEVAEAVPEADCESESVVARGTRFSRATPRRTS